MFLRDLSLSNSDDFLNDNEMKSVRALLAYVSVQNKTDEEAVRSFVGSRFGVKEITELRQRDYEGVVRFLVDLSDEMIAN